MKKTVFALVAVALLSGCATGPEDPAQERPRPSATREPTATAPSATSPIATSDPPPAAQGDDVTGTVVRFTSDQTTVDITVDQDTPAVRDFLSMLPLSLSIEEFNGKEKIAYLPREIQFAGTTGSDPENGDLIYFTPWGNLGFYYDASGIGYTDQTLHIGTFTAGREQLALLETGVVTVAVVEQ